MSFGFGFGFPRNYVAALFTPGQLFTNGEPGAWYDPSDLSTLFQDAAGTTPVTAVEQPVGLMLDKSKGLVLGSELWPSSPTWNTAGTGVSTAGSTVTFSSASPGAIGYVNLGLVSGGWYKVTITVSGFSSGQTYINLGGNSPNTSLVTANGTYTTISQATPNPYIYVTSTVAGTTANVTVSSVKALPGNHAYQSASANRPVLSARVNLLTKTEDWTAAGGWSADANIIAVVQANPAYSRLTKSGTSDAFKRQVISTAAGVPYTATFTVQKDSDVSRFPEFYLAGANDYVYLDLNTATGAYINRVQAGIRSYTVVDAGSEWKITLSITASVSGLVECGVRPACGTTLGVFSATATGAITIAFPDLRVSNDGVNLPAYQRVNTSTDYDTAGFPLYLKTDGVDDGMVTNSIDFTGTDKMTVFAGLRKLSDAGTAALLEFGYGANGYFSIFAPDAPNLFVWSSKGTANSPAATANASYAAPATDVLTGVGNISGDQSVLRVNGTQAASSTVDQGTGNYGNYPLYLFTRGGTSLPFNGRCYGLIVRGAQSSAAQIADAEKWMNSKTTAYEGTPGNISLDMNFVNNTYYSRVI